MIYKNILINKNEPIRYINCKIFDVLLRGEGEGWVGWIKR